MTEPEKEFVHELEVFRAQAQAGTQFFYAYLAMNVVIGENPRALDAVNKTPLFWKTNMGALQTAFFVVLGRIFDQRSKHNIHNLLRLAQNNRDILSKRALAARKRRDSSNADELLDDYLKQAYEPADNDFRRPKKHVKRYRKIYERNYRDIRRKVFAHTEFSEEADIRELYKRTNIRQLERLFVFLNQFHSAFWELFHNGRKPILRPMRYSVRSIKTKRRPKWQRGTIQELVVNETQDFFDSFRTPNNPLQPTAA